MGLTSRQVGAALGVSHTAINRAAKRGRIPRESDGTFDLEKVRAVWVQNADQHQRARVLKAKKKSAPAESPRVAEAVPAVGESGGPIETLQAAQTRKESALADLKELEAKQKSGKLLPTEEVAHQWGRIIAAARNGLLLIPSKVAPELAVVSDVRRCQAILEKEIRLVLDQLTTDEEYDDEAI